MRRIALIGAAGALGLVAACSDYDEGNNAAYAEGENAEAYADGNAAGGNAYGTNTAAAGSWPAGSRIVVENGVTYRIDPGGARIVLGPSDARIVEEGGVRFRVDPDGTRVRIDDQGAVVVDTDGVNANVNLGGDTSVEVNTQ